MHPFPDAGRLQFLVGQELLQVCLGFWQIQFHFESGAIFAEGNVEHTDVSGVARRHNADENRRDPIMLHHLLGKKVRTVTADPYRLALSFEDGNILRISSDYGPYECGQIYYGSGAVTVF